MVTPEAQVKSLKLALFDEVEEHEENYLLQNALVTEAQVRRFHEYKKDRFDEPIERVMVYFEELTPSEKKTFFKKLEEMVKGN